jgi:hypothetical protein
MNILNGQEKDPKNKNTRAKAKPVDKQLEKTR